MSPDSAAEHVWNLDQYPWPLEADCFRADPYVARDRASGGSDAGDGGGVAGGEGWRGGVRHDAALQLANSYTDPTHRRHLAAASFEYFTGKDFPTFAGSPYRFDIVQVELTFGGNFLLDGLGRWLARRNLKWYERHAAWVFPALDIRAVLRARQVTRRSRPARRRTRSSRRLGSRSLRRSRHNPGWRGSAWRGRSISPAGRGDGGRGRGWHRRGSCRNRGGRRRRIVAGFRRTARDGRRRCRGSRPRLQHCGRLRRRPAFGRRRPSARGR